MHISSTEENYLKAIYNLTLEEDTAATNAIAYALNTSAASVSDMIKKLADKKLLNYEKYKGAKLSDKGFAHAVQLIRKHRLWETFLVNTLGFDWAEVHDIAEQLEHVRSPELIARLDSFLQYPKYDPHGDPIPDKEGKIIKREQHKLASMPQGETVEICHVMNDDEDFLNFLNSLNLCIGQKLTIKERIKFDESIKIELPDNQIILLTKSICDQIKVIRT